MPSPFPGMDPFLEAPEIWSGFHHSLGEAIKRQLNRTLSDAYYADVEIQAVLEDSEVEIAHRMRPDVSIYETLFEASEMLPRATATVAIPDAPIHRLAPLPTRLRSVRVYRTETRELVTTIELLSPYNKRPGSHGLSDYLNKRSHILASWVHLVEVDLLRGGERPGPEVADEPLDTDYVLLVNRFGVQRLSAIWPVPLNESLPLIPVPLLPPDPDVPLDLNAAIRDVYDNSRYERRITYRLPVPLPPLRPAISAWVESLLAERANPTR